MAKKECIKCTRFYLTYDDSEKVSYQVVMAELFNIQRQIRDAKNFAVSEPYVRMMWQNQCKKQTGEYPDDVTKYGKPFGSYLYDQMKEKIPSMQTGNISTIQKSLSDNFKSDMKEILKGDKSIASFKQNQPIEISGQNIKKIYFEDGEAYIQISLFSSPERKELGLTNGIIQFRVWRLDSNTKAILQKCVAGEYTHRTGSLIYDNKKKKWRMSLTYAFAPRDYDLDPNKIMGIDVGVANPIYCAFSDSYARLRRSGGQIEHFNGQILRRYHNIQRDMKFASPGSCGHGRKTRLKGLDFATGAVARFRDTYNDITSRDAINCAIRNGAGTIQMEKLDGINEKERFLKTWSYYDLQLKIKQKAKAAGINVVMVNPAYTSQRCSKCGYIHSGNRKTQSDFRCLSCGYTTHADYNAARNLATKDIEQIIGASVKHTA